MAAKLKQLNEDCKKKDKIIENLEQAEGGNVNGWNTDEKLQKFKDQLKKATDDLEYAVKENEKLLSEKIDDKKNIENCLEEIDILNRELMNRKHFQNKAQWAQITKKIPL